MSAPTGSSAFAPPRQDRSRRSMHRMIDAAVELLTDRPFDEITVDDIVERAGYTKGAFYHRFDGKAALLRHLIDRLTVGALEAWDEFLDPDRWEDASLAELLEAFVRRLVTIYARSGNVMRAFGREAYWGADQRVRATAADLNRHVTDRLTALVEPRRDELAERVRGDPEAATRFWVAALIGLLQSTMLWPSPGLNAIEGDDVEARAVALMVPYLTTG